MSIVSSKQSIVGYRTFLLPRVAGFDIVRVLLGLLLLTATALKGYQLATEPVANKNIFSYRWSLAVQVEFELLLGLWLISGLHKRLAWMAGLLCFAFFCCVTFYKAATGEASCGCFGRVAVNPWYTLILDVSAVIGLLVFRPGRSEPPVPRYGLRLALTAVIALCLGIPAGITVASYKPTIVAESGDLVGNGKFVLLEPEKWAGKSFPLLSHIDVGERLSKGAWVVLLYHHDCPDCAEAIPQYHDMALEMKEMRQPLSLAMVEMPPYGHAGSSRNRHDASSALQGKLDDREEWFVTTPVVMLVVDGIVKAAWEAQAPGLAIIAQTYYRSS